jgi:hypothetical protein
VSFIFKNVFVGRDAIEFNLHFRKFAAKWLKLPVHKHVLNSESAFHIFGLDVANAVSMVFADGLGGISAVQNLIFRDTVRKNGILLLTKSMMSPPNTMAR